VPFTLSHVAAVIPGHRLLSRAHVFTAAVIGSMVPDFGLLIPRNTLRWQTHSIPALLTFCLPVGLLAYWLTQLVIKPAMIEVLPDRAYLRLRASDPHVPITNLRHWFSATVALLLGAVTHLFWDNFTHEDARGVRMFPVLDDYGPEMDGHPVHIYRWLQYGSSVFGLVVVLVALLVWLRHAPLPDGQSPRQLLPMERTVWMGVYLLLPMIFIVTAGWQSWSSDATAFGASGVVRIVAVEGMRSFVACLLLVSVLLRTRLAT
jgi:hypothetical protein